MGHLLRVFKEADCAALDVRDVIVVKPQATDGRVDPAKADPALGRLAPVAHLIAGKNLAQQVAG